MDLPEEIRRQINEYIPSQAQVEAHRAKLLLERNKLARMIPVTAKAIDTRKQKLDRLDELLASPEHQRLVGKQQTAKYRTKRQGSKAVLYSEAPGPKPELYEMDPMYGLGKVRKVKNQKAYGVYIGGKMHSVHATRAIAKKHVGGVRASDVMYAPPNPRKDKDVSVNKTGLPIARNMGLTPEAQELLRLEALNLPITVAEDFRIDPRAEMFRYLQGRRGSGKGGMEPEIEPPGLRRLAVFVLDWAVEAGLLQSVTPRVTETIMNTIQEMYPNIGVLAQELRRDLQGTASGILQKLNLNVRHRLPRNN